MASRTGRASESKTHIPGMGMLRSAEIPRLLALETMSQNLVRRSGNISRVPPHVLFHQQVKRLPLIGIRSQHVRVQGRFNQVKEYHKDPLRMSDRLTNPPATRTICEKRAQRKEVLFKLGIAGKGQRRSPGAGGRYRRSVGSEYTCRTVRR